MKGKESMNESKKQGEQFTPGPWTAYELGAENGTWAKWSIVHNGPIAYGGDNGKGSENSRATAQLMAAAPELLAALEWAVDQIEDSLDFDHQAALEGCKAAIAKARGAK